MARTRDRWLISEAVRTQDLWRIEDLDGQRLVLVTAYAEWLHIRYDRTGAVKSASYLHRAEDGTVASSEQITRGKRARVLHLITQKDVGDYVGRDGATYNADGTRKGSIAEALKRRRTP